MFHRSFIGTLIACISFWTIYVPPQTSAHQIVPDSEIEAMDQVTQADVADDWSEAPGAISPRPRAPRFGGPLSQAKGQPDGALTDIIVYCGAGHGWTAYTSSWNTQRPLLHGMVEDMGNIDQLTMYAQYCFNAGATVVPFRPIGNQVNEVVLDNDDGEVTYTGTWNDSTATLYYGDPGDVPYRFAHVDPSTETATARYTPSIPEAGYYPVYCWTRRGTDRVKQVYRINASGGTSEVKVNHARVGSGWIWLGTYYFEAGTGGSVEISNLATGEPTTKVVIADTIRFGNGMGDIDRGFGVSGFSRELECGRYWVQNANGQGMPTSLYDLNGFNDHSDGVGAPARMADYMDDESNGTFWDRIYLGFHSNAIATQPNTFRRGALGLYSTSNSSAKEALQNQWGSAVNAEIENDLEALDEGVVFPENFNDTSADILAGVYGEINDSSNPNMNTTIIEVGYHDNADDAKLMKDMLAREIIARACYQATVRHLNANNGTVVPLDLFPDRPTHVTAENDGAGGVTVNWRAPVVDGVGGEAATGYVVYRSANGYGFGEPVTVTGGGTLTTTITGLTVGDTWYFQVAAVNDGGESMPSETVGVRVRAEAATVLVVDGYDRADRFLTPSRFFANNLNGNVALMNPLKINAHDYVVQHGEAIAEATFYFDSTVNEAVIDGDVDLADYDTVVWMCGRESTSNETFSTQEQGLVQAYLMSSGTMFVSGSEIAWDLDQQGQTADEYFHINMFRCLYERDDAGTYTAVGSNGSIFDGILPFTFDDGSGPTYDVSSPDVLQINSGEPQAALRYGNVGAGGDIAAIQYDDTWKLIYLAFPFETILDLDTRNEIMARSLAFFQPNFAEGAVIISEIMDNPQSVSDNSGEWFELFNPGADDVDIEGWIVQDADLTDFHTISNGAPLIVPAGGFLVLGRSTNTASNGGVPVDYAYGSDMSLTDTDDIILKNGAYVVTAVDYAGSWPGGNGESMELQGPDLDESIAANWGTATTSWSGSGGDLGSPGEESDVWNPGIPPEASITITEVMQNPDEVSDTNGEWFEIFNLSGDSIDINGWTISDDGNNSHVIDNGGPLTLSGHGYLVLGRNADSMENGGVTVDYEYSSFSLDNSKDEIIVSSPYGEEARVEYDGGPSWPDPTGSSMELIDPILLANFGPNWVAATAAWPGSAGDNGSPGAENGSSSLPVINISNPPTTVSFATTTYDVYGDANGVVVGDIFWANALNGATGTFASATYWTLPSVPLEVGSNVISVIATNDMSESDIDQVEIVRLPSVVLVPTILISEIMADPVAVGDGSGEWFELYNYGDSDIDINGWTLQDDTGGESHTIDNGSSLVIPAGGYLILGRNADMGSNGGVAVDYQYAGFVLNNTVDSIVLKDNDLEVARVDYDFSLWPLVSGASMQLNDPNLDMNDPVNWSTSSTGWSGGGGDSGSPADDNEFGVWNIGAPGLPQVIITDLDDTVPNTTLSTDVSGTANSSVIGDLLWSNDATGGAGTIPAATNWMVSGIPLGVGDNFIDVTGTNSLGQWDFDLILITRLPEPGLADVIVSEIMHNPVAVDDANGEWVELYNLSDVIVDIDGWKIADDDGDGHIFDNGGPLLILPGGFLVIGINDNPAQNGGVPVDYEYNSFFLDNDEDEVVLLDFGVNEVTRVNYSGVPPWTNPEGASMELLNVPSDENDPDNWGTAIGPWPGSAGDDGSPGQPPAFGQQRIISWNPIVSIMRVGSSIEVCIEPTAATVNIEWTDDLTFWPPANSAVMGTPCWTDPGTPPQSRHYRVSTDVP